MARLDDLIAQIRDGALRQKLDEALSDLRRRQRFGLVFEEHVPETTALVGFPASVGATVQRRCAGSKELFRVKAINGRGTLTLEPEVGGEEQTADVKDVMVVKRFGDPIFPALTSVGKVERGPEERPFHAVINGENFHALQLLVYLYKDQVDCIYIDPPYNTGARDWKYNNDYVDAKDTWRHSKWLSFMEKRLKLARRLLKPDGVLIVTIDENEVHHLGMLLAKLFPTARRQMVSICINPGGASGAEGGLSRVEEYAIFCFFGEAQPVEVDDDMLVTRADEDAAHTGARGIRWEWLMRGGNAWYRDSRRNLCYPIILSDDGTRIIGTGTPLEGREDKRRKKIDGHPVAWPVRRDGKLGIWRVDPTYLMTLVKRGYAFVSERDAKRGTWTIKYLMSGTIEEIESGVLEVIGKGERGEVQVRVPERRSKVAKTMWMRPRHIAGGAGGTHLLNTMLGERNVFPFPKSVYAVRDCLKVAIGNRPNALILDFFAGSGTTFNATCLLNAEDGGTRRSIIATNNEVNHELTQALNRSGHFKGDPEYEKHGIFERATRPRCEAVVTGNRPDGSPVEGAYLDGRQYAEGFSENVEFFRIDYLDPDDVDLGNQFNAILPSLWLSAGGVGARNGTTVDQGFYVPTGSRYAILFDEAKFRKLKKVIDGREDVTHLWVVTDSEDAFAEMRAALPARLTTSMLYRDYLRTFKINTRNNL